MEPNWTRVLLHTERRNRRLVDPADVYYLEAAANTTLVRLRGRTPLVDLRSLGEVFPFFEPQGFLRIHRNHAETRMMNILSSRNLWGTGTGTVADGNV